MQPCPKPNCEILAPPNPFWMFSAFVHNNFLYLILLHDHFLLYVIVPLCFLFVLQVEGVIYPHLSNDWLEGAADVVSP